MPPTTPTPHNILRKLTERLELTDKSIIKQYRTSLSILSAPSYHKLANTIDRLSPNEVIDFLIANTIFAEWVRRFDTPLQQRALLPSYCAPTTILRPSPNEYTDKYLNSFSLYTQTTNSLHLPLRPTHLEIEAWLNLYIKNTNETPIELLGFGREIIRCGYTHQQLVDEVLIPLQNSTQQQPDLDRYPVIALMHVLWRYMYGYFLSYYGNGDSDNSGSIDENRDIYSLWLQIHRRLSHPLTYDRESITIVSTEDLQLTAFQIKVLDYLPHDPRVIEQTSTVLENIYIDAWEKDLIDKSPSERKLRERDWSQLGIHSAKALFREAIPTFVKGNYT